MNVAGVFVSVRNLGNGLGVLMAIFGISLLLSSRLKNVVVDLKNSLDQLLFRQQSIIIFYLTFLFLLAVLSHKLKAHHALDTHAFDLGFFSNICWNTAQGKWFYSSFLERNFMAVHVNWILWPLSIFFKWGGDARTLLWAQAVIFAGALPLLWRAVQEVTGRFSLGGMAALLMVCSPVVSHGIENDFHPDIWQVPMLYGALLCWVRGKTIPMLIFALLAILAKEDVSFVLAGFGIFLWLDRRMRGAGLFIFILAVAIFIFQSQVFIPQFLEPGTKSVLFTRYPILGSDYQEMIRNLFLKPWVYFQALVYDPMKFWRLFCMLVPALGLTFFSPLFLIPCLISVAPHLLSQASTQLQLSDIYAMPLQPFIFVGAAFGFKKLQSLGQLSGREWVLMALAMIVAGVGVTISPRFYHASSKERIAAFEQVKSLVPREASVAAQQNLYPHFDTRSLIQIFPLGIAMPPLQSAYLANPDYLIGDRFGNPSPYSRDRKDQEIQEMEKNPRYEKVFDQAGFVVFRRNSVEEPVWKKS